MSQKPFKRSVLLINRPFQLSIIGYFTALAVVVYGLFMYHIYTKMSELQIEAKSLYISADHPFSLYLKRTEYLFYIETICMAVATICIFYMVALIVSHRVAGPLYRLRTHLEKSTESGKLVKLHFRNKDYFKDVEIAYNNYVEKVYEMHPELRPEEEMPDAKNEEAAPESQSPDTEKTI